MKSRRAHFINWINLRTLVVIVGMALVLTAQRPSSLQLLDRWLFYLGAGLMQPKAELMPVALVELPDSEMHYLVRDAGQAQQTQQLLQKLLSSGATIGLILEDVPNYSAEWAQTVLEELQNNKSAVSEVKKASGEFLTTQKKLLDAFNHAQVVLGSPSASTLQMVAAEPSAASDVLRWLPFWLRPQASLLKSEKDSSETQLNVYATENYLAEHNIHYPLFWRTETDIGVGFLLKLYSRYSRSDELTWHQNKEIALGNGISFPLSADGSFLPFFTQQKYLDANVLSLEAALQTVPRQQLVLIGGDAQHLRNVAAALQSLDNESYFYKPVWAVVGELVAVALITLYLVILLPRLALLAGLLATCLLIVLLVVLQAGWQITQWIWMPTGIAIQFLLFGHVLILLWKYQRDRLFNAQAAAHGARYQLGLQLFRDGRPDDALLAIKECFVSDAVAQLMYDIAAQQERKRQYGAAIKTYQILNQQKKQFRDVGEKIEKLIAFSSGTAASLSNGGDIAKTLIVSETTIHKPVLGRYEIERELGRGAMGVVYLGRDPKIGRQVAIKTLSYSNLDESHLDEFKQRFFREAEAAGRLSHHNIVTIYDVGEEHDLAFIAMDYIKGKPLSAYISADTLLPVAIVYQVIVEVAEGLAYAHRKQVIHRDIKPGNIMYQPENALVKITDFGVARIVDNAKTNTGDILGSPLYMSPEQLKGEKVTAQTDIYSLGVTLYQLLTAKVPFTGDSIASLTYNIIHEKHKGVRDLRPDLPMSATRIVNRALSKDPTKRFKTVMEMAHALQKSLNEDFNL